MEKLGYILSVGRTPLTRLERISAMVEADVYVKQERCNPTGSVKDRSVWYMVKDAIEQGILVPGSKKVTMIEPTSGNAGISLAALGAALKIPVVIVMPDSVSMERRKMMSIYDAKVILTPASEGMRGAVEETRRIIRQNPGHYFMSMQFENPANVRAHYELTGPEIAAELGGSVDYLVAGVGTGGTLTGTGRFLRTLNPDLSVIAVEPSTSPVIRQCLHGESIHPGPHGIQGIGAGFVPQILDLSLLNDAIGVETRDAVSEARDLLRLDGISTGYTGGANIAAILEMSRRGLLIPGKTVVSFIPDGIDRHMTSAIAE